MMDSSISCRGGIDDLLSELTTIQVSGRYRPCIRAFKTGEIQRRDAELPVEFGPFPVRLEHYRLAQLHCQTD
jgi:hypothetical protein